MDVDILKSNAYDLRSASPLVLLAAVDAGSRVAFRLGSPQG